MADSKCCFGCSNVRKGTWIISIFDMFICVLLTIKTLSMIIISPSTFKKPRVAHSSSYGEEAFTIPYNNNMITERRFQLMENDFIIFLQLFIIFLFLAANLNLKRATYLHNTQSINHWLTIYSTFFIFFSLFVGFTTINNSTIELIPGAIPVGIVLVYQMYVVKCFYNDELKFLAESERNIGTQPALNSHQYITITNPPIQSSHYPVQSGPYIIQQVPQSVTQAPYPQQTYQFQPQQPHQFQPQQPPSQSHAFVPQPEPQSQEYCNPPPYSPTYNVQEGSSVKQ